MWKRQAWSLRPLRRVSRELGTPQELARRVADPLLGTQTLVRDLIMPHLRESHQQLREAARDADLLVSHPLTFMLQVVAAEQRKPWLSSVLAPASFLSRNDPPAMAPINSMQIAQRLGPWAYDPLMRFIRGTVRRWEQPLHELRAELGMPRSDKIMVFEGQFSPLGTLALFDAPLMQPQADWPPHTRLCGTPLYDGSRGRSFVAGRAAGIPGRRRCAHRVRAGIIGRMAGWGFLACAIEAARQLGRRAILVTGADPLPDLPASVRVFSYLPYSQVFPHACAVVHQAGIGTLSQALRAGRPQLITPVWFDQPDNAARACKLGVARTLPFRRATAARLVSNCAACWRVGVCHCRA